MKIDSQTKCLFIFLSILLFFSLSHLKAQERERFVNFAVEYERITERTLLNNGGKAVITTPLGSAPRELESFNEEILSTSNILFLKCSLNILPAFSLYGKAGLTSFDWNFILSNPPGQEPGTSQKVAFEGKRGIVYGIGAKVRLFEIAGLKAEIDAGYLNYNVDGKFYINDIEFKKYEEEQFKIQHGGGTVDYTVKTTVNEIATSLVISKKFGRLIPYLGGGYITMEPITNLVMEGTPQDIGYAKMEIEFKSKLKEHSVLFAGMIIKVSPFTSLDIRIKTKGISSLLASISMGF